MNTGIQDAFNLAIKIALVMQKKSPPSILAAYHEERHAVAQEILHTTDQMFTFIVSPNRLLRFLRITLLPVFAKLLTSFSAVRLFMFKRIGQLLFRYASSIIERKKCGRFSCVGLKP